VYFVTWGTGRNVCRGCGPLSETTPNAVVSLGTQHDVWWGRWGRAGESFGTGLQASRFLVLFAMLLTGLVVPCATESMDSLGVHAAVLGSAWSQLGPWISFCSSV
jgi:hypothetical protein